MRTKLIALPVVMATVAFAGPLHAGSWSGTIKLGGIVLDEEGDYSAVQETFNIYDGFSVSQLRLSGSPDEKHFVSLDLREINLDARRGTFFFRHPGTAKITASFDQSRQVFDPDRATTSDRKDWRVGARFTPAKWLWLSGSFNNLTRDGDRLTFPLGTETVLGTEYDYALRTGSVSAEARRGSRGLAVGYQMSDFSNDLDAAGDRTGRVVSARLFGPCFFYDKLTHLARASYGVSELSNAPSIPSDIDYKLYTFQYTGVVRPVPRLRFAYTFDAQRVDNESTDLQTDRFRNVFDATVYHAYGSVSGGYAYETNDDDRSLTSFNSWQGAATFRYENTLRAKIRYDGRVKKDLEELTLLKDVESARFRADVDVTPISDLTVGGGFSVREREYPDIDVKSEGQSYRAAARYAFPGWGRCPETTCTPTTSTRISSRDLTLRATSSRVELTWRGSRTSACRAVSPTSTWARTSTSRSPSSSSREATGS